jgi:hypothetical protein
MAPERQARRFEPRSPRQDMQRSGARGAATPRNVRSGARRRQI